MKRTIEEELEKAVEYWDLKHLIDFLRDIMALYELYDVEEDSDWVKNEVGELNERNVRLIRTVYLISKIAENHSGALLGFKTKFPKLWQRMEKNNAST